MLSNKEVALLGLLSEGPNHPYGLEQAIEARSMREWTEISISSIYKVLAKLEREGLVKSKEARPGKTVAQKVYAMTPAGLKAYRARLLEIVSEPEKMIYRIDLALSHLGVLPLAEARRALLQYVAKLEEGIKCYGELEKYLVGGGCPWFAQGMAKRPQYLLKAEREWAKDYLKELDRNSR